MSCIKMIAREHINATVCEFSNALYITRSAAYDVYGEFRRISDYYDENEAIFYIGNGREAAIVAGVAETVKMKLESIDEQLRIFSKETTEFLTNFYNGGLRREAVCEAEKYCAQHAGLMNKKIVDFKKKSLLHEICTFEEIINYSVARLRECADESVGLFVEIVDEACVGISRALARHEIEVIEPQIRQRFDGKRHDVILAEVVEGFKRGEVIKVLNCGYMQDGEVLVRANVVAAR